MPKNRKMEIGYKTDIGLVRKKNEDRFLVDQELCLFIVADGMGGHQGGEVASEMAVKIVASSLRDSLKNGKDIVESIHGALQTANEAIWTRAEMDKELNGMGTTVVLALYCKDKIHIAHIGDSRAYLIQDKRIKQLTQDHSVVNELLRAGQITKEDSYGHHLRHIVTRILGSKGPVEPDITLIEPEDGHHLLLCSDGLTDLIRDEEINYIVCNGSDLQKISEDLISKVRERGGKDNVTVILLSTHMHKIKGFK
jgi:PPM family protein phosphatase